MPTYPFVVPVVGAGVAGQNHLNKTAPQNFVIRLFQNNHTPADTDVAGSFTEATFPGYASINLAGASWAEVDTTLATFSFAQQTFTCNANFAGQTIYGYYYTGAADGILRGAQLFDNPVVIKSNTEFVKVTPVYTVQGVN